MKKLDPSTLEALAELICGDNKPWYRKGWQLPIFFRNAGLNCTVNEDDDNYSRKQFALKKLQEYNKNPAEIEKVIKRIADPKEYRGDQETVNNIITELNKILFWEGLKVELEAASPQIKEIPPGLVDPEKETFRGFYIPDVSKIIKDQSLENILLNRMNEALKCINNGAYLSAIIMMGSFLEGVLLAVLNENPREANTAQKAPKDSTSHIKKFRDWTLSEMIDVAHERGWIKDDVRKFSHALRDYRNMVHPWHQKEMNENPDKDTCKICWQVVAAAINNLVSSLGD
ncbi:MAG: hypothetical protein N2248_06195 [candidate division WOR-3 bacterium]|uniref:DUF4145 domain-containing protein n=1 Tax=candidate division WOR-3 bacterium TaxID=2052148 RepID=A0A7C1NTH5_UNCW3|nr:hypothetical protein [candidate division WOR-3 bacterium]